ncbi:MAG: hypothetical protein KC620_08295, partial [Myxococcales bacterium]|nr:hypothetical protein [Myxococcales bacterium]
PTYDGAEPSGNALVACGLVRLAEITGDEAYRRRAAGAVRALGPLLEKAPHAAPKALCALDRLLEAGRQVIVVTPDPQRPAEMLASAAQVFAPDATLLFGPADGPLAKAVPAFADRVAQGGASTAYVCIGTRCDLPTTSPKALADRLRR